MFNIDKIRNDFPLLTKNKDLVYFDNAATTLKPQVVIDEIMNVLSYESVNVHRGDYNLSHHISTKFDNVRVKVAKFINAETKEIVFTSGASESLNLVAYGYGRKYLKEGDIILSSEAEHASNILPWFKVAEETKAEVKYIKLSENGEFTLDNFKAAMNDRVKVVSLANVTNVLGYILPMKEICAIAHSYGAIVICDGAQSVPHTITDVKDMDCDFLAFSAHKMCGPTGVGILYGKYDLLQDLEPFMLGGGSNARFDMCGNIKLKDAPYKFESGTPPIEGIIGLGSAIDYLTEVGMKNIHQYEVELHTYLIEKLKELKHITIYNPNAGTGIVSFNVEGIFPQDAASYLNKFNIAVRSGNHCAKILMNVLKTQYTIRASLYFYNTKEEVDAFVDALKDISLDKCVDIVI